MKTNQTTRKRLTGGILLAILLTLCLVVTTYALVYYSVYERDNFFQTGGVKINLNDGKAIIGENAADYNGEGVSKLFEPGMTVKREFFIQNESTDPVYYRLYFKDVSGGLADVLHITVKDGDKVLYSGVPSRMGKSDMVAADDQLDVGQKRVLTMYFYFPRETGNTAQDKNLTFTLCADATQVRNNPGKAFD